MTRKRWGVAGRSQEIVGEIRVANRQFGAEVHHRTSTHSKRWAEPFSVALPPSGDLFICAKDLFIAATDEKAPAIDGRGKLAERIEVEFGPFRPACIA